MKAGLADRRWQIGDGRVGGKWKAGGGRGLSTFHLKSAPKRSAAFTLIELLGVMAIIGILSAVILPPMIAKIEDAQTTNEDANLEEIARALVLAIKANGRFPDPNVDPLTNNGWVAMGTAHSVLGTNAFYYVSPRNTNSKRKLYLDASVVSNLTMPSSGWSASSFPSATLMFIVSSSKPELFTSSATNGNGCQTSANQFQTNLLNDLKQWRKVYDTNGRITAPSSVAGNWPNRGEYLHVKIVDLKKILSKVSLEDWHTPASIYEASQINIPNAYSPKTNPIFSQGYIISWTNNGGNYTWSLDAQPEKVSLGAFSNTSTSQRYDVFQINFDITNSQGNQNSRQLKIRARESAGYSFVAGQANNTAITIFDNPQPANSQSKETTNFFALKGSSLILYPSSANTNNPQFYNLDKENHRFIFKSGSWGSAD